MKIKTSVILDCAQKISKQYKRTSALKLKSIYDSYTSKIILPWRKNYTNEESHLHSMVSRVGGFPPSLVRYFIVLYSSPGDIILDPFCGKGTTLLESIMLGRKAIGGDIASDAIIISKAKCSPVTMAEVSNYIRNLKISSSTSINDIPKNVSLFFSKNTLRQIVSIRNQILNDMNGDNRNKKRISYFICGIMLGILHGHSSISLSLPCNQCFAMSPNYVRSYIKKHNLERPNRNVKKCLLTKAKMILPFPDIDKPSYIYEIPAQKCYSYVSRLTSKPNLVVTSPPYLNRQTYIRDAWLRLWFLDRLHNEKHLHSMETGSIQNFIEDMEACLMSIWKSLSKKSYLVMVCGKANITLKGKSKSVRISDLCLLAAKQVKDKAPFKIKDIYSDKVLMKRGSYFAVHSGKRNHNNERFTRRYGEDEIIVFKKIDKLEK